ncbi:hypothetical protein [Rhodobium gokarnense]|uniref:HTH cro/C1-type domain-containing protein n=1 Tax=Rhodobium gokarnense TaxID=364296 RepID=A0ABT3HH40_9HYPH|nr:hypothetical protein [Rhodobium gokarnense]
MGVREVTYVSHENGTRGMTADAAIRYARFFRISLKWLLTGEGPKRGDEAEPPAPLDTAGAPYSGKGVILAPIVGKAEATSWIHVDDIQDDILGTIPVVPDPRFDRADYVAYQVVGDSFDEFVRDGGYVVAVPWAKTGMSPRSGLPVVVEQFRNGGSFRERTLKEISIRNGRIMLAPRSSNPRHKPIDIGPINASPNDEVEVQIAALVITFVQPAVF